MICSLVASFATYRSRGAIRDVGKALGLPHAELERLARLTDGWNARRVAEDFAIVVTEPPVANRPVGYRLGDVGQFQVSALVQPRRVDEGGSVAVTVTAPAASKWWARPSARLSRT